MKRIARDSDLPTTPYVIDVDAPEPAPVVSDEVIIGRVGEVVSGAVPQKSVIRRGIEPFVMAAPWMRLKARTACSIAPTSIDFVALRAARVRPPRARTPTAAMAERVRHWHDRSSNGRRSAMPLRISFELALSCHRCAAECP